MPATIASTVCQRQAGTFVSWSLQNVTELADFALPFPTFLGGVLGQKTLGQEVHRDRRLQVPARNGMEFSGALKIGEGSISAALA